MFALRRRVATLVPSLGRHGAMLSARLPRRKLEDMIEATTFPAASLGKRRHLALSRMPFVALLPLFLWVGTPADAAIQTCHSRTIQGQCTGSLRESESTCYRPQPLRLAHTGALQRKHRTVKTHSQRLFPNPYSAWPNPFTIKPNPYGAWPNPFTVEPTPT